MAEEELQPWVQRVNRETLPSGGGLKTPEQGAASSIWCALSERQNGMGGVYCEDCDIAGVVPDDSPVGNSVRAYAIDPEKAAGLWRFSEGVTGLRWP